MTTMPLNKALSYIALCLPFAESQCPQHPDAALDLWRTTLCFHPVFS
jgi:hypothetical protein